MAAVAATGRPPGYRGAVGKRRLWSWALVTVGLGLAVVGAVPPATLGVEAAQVLELVRKPAIAGEPVEVQAAEYWQGLGYVAGLALVLVGLAVAGVGSRPGPGRRSLLLIAGVPLVLLAGRMALEARASDGLHPDSLHYLGAATSFELDGSWTTRAPMASEVIPVDDAAGPARYPAPVSHYPPAYGLQLLALGGIDADRVVAARWANAIGALLVVALGVLLAARSGGRAGALFGGLALACCPPLLESATAVMSEVPFMVLVALAALSLAAAGRDAARVPAVWTRGTPDRKKRSATQGTSPERMSPST